MAELLDEASHLESTTVGVFRTAATVKGGRRFSFSSLVVVGDRNGRVGYGYGKSNEVPTAIEKAQKAAKRNMMDVKLEGKTIPHEVEGRYLASKVRLLPASPGTGVVAGSKVRSVLELAGITDCMTKCYGSTNAINTVKAVFDGLKALRTAQEVAELRGVQLGTTDIQERIAKGSRFMQSVPGGKRAAEPGPADENSEGDDR
jgi:small subunit ribosomal protein S5